MIPNHSHDGVLPPFFPGDSPTKSAEVSPYKTEIYEFVQKYGTNKERREILKGLVDYRKALRSVDITTGFQWLDGSFVEDCEKLHDRPPSDIDIITFAFRPKIYKNTEDWAQFIKDRPDLFDPDISKKQYKCDAYFIDLDVNPIQIVAETHYWFGLFSHQRVTYLWKGMIEVPLVDDGGDVELLLTSEVQDAS